VTNEWVVISPERSKRPEDYVHSDDKKDDGSDCPFCPGGAALQTVVHNAGTQNVFVIPNKYPAFGSFDDRVISEGEEFYFSTPSRGAHEVIIFKPHKMSFGEMPIGLIREIFETYKKRLDFYENNPEVEHAMIIHNHGKQAGASIAHPHSQLMASSVVPPIIKKELDGTRDYWLKTGGCVFCDILRNEENADVRVVYQNKYFLAVTAFAARFPFETWVIPYEHKANFSDIDETEIEALADVMKHILGKLDQKLINPDFNFWIHSIPYRQIQANPYYHWHLEIAPRLSTYGGYELGAGLVVDVVSPESAARFLKD